MIKHKPLVFILFSLIAFVGSGAYADTKLEAVGHCHSCTQSDNTLKKLEWFSADMTSVLRSPCSRTTPFTVKEMTNYIMSKIEDPEEIESQKINGISFKDENPYLLRLFKDLHTREFEGSRDKPIIFNSKCEKVICAVNQIYGDPVGTQILFMLSKFGFNGSFHRALQPENYSPFRKGELDDILMALDSLPPQLYPTEYNRQLLKFARGYTLKSYASGNPNERVLANARIDLFDGWSEKDRQGRMMTLIHEIGHVVAKGEDEKHSWTNTAGWQRKPQADGQGEWFQIDSQRVPSIYAGTNPAEDYAESFVAYRFNPKQFRQKFPGRYSYMQTKHFPDVQFSDVAGCSPAWKKDKNEQLERLAQQKNLKLRRDKSREEARKLTRLFITPFSRKLTRDEQNHIIDSCAVKVIREAADSTIPKSDCIRIKIAGIAIEEQGKKMGVTVLKEDINAELARLTPIMPDAITKAQTSINKEISNALDETYSKTSLVYKLRGENCNDLSDYLPLKLFGRTGAAIQDKKGNPLDKASLKTVLTKACELNINSFGGKYIPQPLNIFAGNPFKKILNQ